MPVRHGDRPPLRRSQVLALALGLPIGIVALVGTILFVAIFALGPGIPGDDLASADVAPGAPFALSLPPRDGTCQLWAACDASFTSGFGLDAHLELGAVPVRTSLGLRGGWRFGASGSYAGGRGSIRVAAHHLAAIPAGSSLVITGVLRPTPGTTFRTLRVFATC